MNFLHQHVGEFKIEAPGHDRSHLGKRRVLDHQDGLVDRFAKMAFDSLPNLGGINIRNSRKQIDRAVEILQMLADNRHVEGSTVLDEYLAISVEQHPPRRAQGPRPLMVVLRHLQVSLVLSDLQQPEADCQHHEHRNSPYLQHGHAQREPPPIFSHFHG